MVLRSTFQHVLRPRPETLSERRDSPSFAYRMINGASVKTICEMKAKLMMLKLEVVSKGESTAKKPVIVLVLNMFMVGVVRVSLSSGRLVCVARRLDSICRS